MDMRTAGCLSGSAECAIMAWAGARLAEFYNLPSASWMCTDSLLDDEQSSMEKMLTALAHALGGVGVIWGMGQLETEKTLSPVQLVMDHEVVLALRRLEQGMPVEEESLAFEAVRDVVEKGEDFMSHPHTMAHFRRELSGSPLLNRVNRQEWLSRGGTTLAARAQKRVDEILAAPPKDYLSDQQRKDIAKVEERVLKSLR
jgi:trimethylamine--corrinoid protein Co-methyltransferase